MKRTAAEEIARLAPDMTPYHRVASRVREWYHSSAPHILQRAIAPRDNSYNVVLHIRRGDIAAEGAVAKPHLLTSNEDISSCVHFVMKRAPSTAVLHVYSQGNVSDFAFLAQWRPRVHLDQYGAMASGHSATALTNSIAALFHHMVSADALIIAKSSLSIVAGYLSRGHVYTPERKVLQTPSMVAHLKGCMEGHSASRFRITGGS